MTRNSQNRRCGTYIFFCKAALESKNARGCSQKLLFEGGMDRKIANREGKGATRANKSGKKVSHQGRLGVRKVIFLMQSARSRFEKLCFPLQREAHFWKKRKKKHMWVTSETKIVLDPTVSPPISPLVRPERVHKQELHTFASFLKGHEAKK